MNDVLFLGDRSRTEFREVWRLIGQSANLVAVPDVPATCAQLADCSDVPVVVVAAAYPGQFSATQIAELRKASPFARIIALLGSWSEGEERTGQPWPADARVFWYEWPTWWSLEKSGEKTGRRSPYAFPLTATSQDRVLSANAKWETAENGGLVAVSTGDYETFAAIAAVLDASGYSSAWVRLHRKPVLERVSAGIWDGGQLSLSEQDDLALFCRRIDPAPVVALLDFPRYDRAQTAHELGAAHLFGKPYSVDDLLFVLAEFHGRDDQLEQQRGAKTRRRVG